MSNKNEKLIFIILFMVLLVILLPTLKRMTGKGVVEQVSRVISKQPPLQPEAVKEAAKDIIEESGISAEYTAPEEKDPLGLPDAFQNLISQLLTPKVEDITLPTLTVSGIIWGSKTPQAIINGKIIKEGDTLEGVEVLEIRKEGIVIFYKGREFTIAVAKANMPQINQLQK